MKPTTNNYHERFTEEQRNIVDGIYKVVNEHCKNNNITIDYNDHAEVFVEAIAVYLINSGVFK